MKRAVRQDFEKIETFLVTGTDVARVCGVTIQAVSNWTKRWSDFPKPLMTVSHGSIYPIDEIDDCLRRHGMTPDWRKK